LGDLSGRIERETISIQRKRELRQATLHCQEQIAIKVMIIEFKTEHDAILRNCDAAGRKNYRIRNQPEGLFFSKYPKEPARATKRH